MLASKVVVGPGRGEVLTVVELEELDAMFPPAPSVGLKQVLAWCLRRRSQFIFDSEKSMTFVCQKREAPPKPYLLRRVAKHAVGISCTSTCAF
jgi:hypothetical protein